jgi:hypothetical protein
MEDFNIEEFMTATQLDWRLQQSHELSGEEWLYVFLCVIVMYIVGGWLLTKCKKA